MKPFSEIEKCIIICYCDEMIDIFDNDLADEFEDGEEEYIVIGKEKFYRKHFESIKAKLNDLR